MTLQKGYKIRSYVNGTTKSGSEYKNYSLTVPSEIAQQLPAGLTFVPRMTDEGLLYEPVDTANSHVELPDWAKQESEAT